MTKWRFFTSGSVRSRILRVLGAVLFLASLAFLVVELRKYEFADVLRGIGRIPPERFLLAGFFASLSYLLVTTYDLVAFRYLRVPLPAGKILLTAFVSDAISNSVGYAALSGGSVRYRLYARWGVSFADTVKVTAFVTFTLWMGFVGDLGFIFALGPTLVPRSVHRHYGSLTVIGFELLAVVAAFLAASFFFPRRQVRLGKLHVTVPSSGTALLQMTVGMLDWFLASLVLYELLPPLKITFFGYFSVFLLAQFLGIVSQVPAGLGVFEAVILLLAGRGLSRSTLLGAVLVFRFIYFVVPLVVAVLCLGWFQLSDSGSFSCVRRLAARWAARVSGRKDRSS